MRAPVIAVMWTSARGYPGHWLRSVFEEVDYRTERPRALKPPVFDTDGDDPDVVVGRCPRSAARVGSEIKERSLDP
jgi:hypothetical protein